MVQWSPDTPSQNAGGGYEYNDHEITGFKKPHLSGPGCGVFGDFSILPVRSRSAIPRTQSSFHARRRQAAPGWYAVTLLKPHRLVRRLALRSARALRSSRFPQARLRISLFNVASDQAGVRNAGFHVTGTHEVQGFGTLTGRLLRNARTVAAWISSRQLDAPIVSYGTWQGTQDAPGLLRALRGAQSGGLGFVDTARTREVRVRVALSFVDPAGSALICSTHCHGWDINAGAQ